MSKSDPAMGVLNYTREELDFYPTPKWCTESLLDFSSRLRLEDHEYIWEPACGLGHISEVLIDRGLLTMSSDIVNRGYSGQSWTADFLETKSSDTKIQDFTHIITNPPYGKILDKFIEKALELTETTNGCVAFLMRNEVDSADSRRRFFGNHPAFSEKLVLTKRPRWFEYQKGDASPRHNYSWFIWDWKNVRKPVITYGK